MNYLGLLAVTVLFFFAGAGEFLSGQPILGWILWILAAIIPVAVFCAALASWLHIPITNR